jgi:hypothetical protein
MDHNASSLLAVTTVKHYVQGITWLEIAVCLTLLDLQDQRIYDSLRSRLPSSRGQLERPTPAQSDVTLTAELPHDVGSPDGATEMERSDGEVTAGNEPMDE